jgi:hypothetical protein
MGVGPRIVMRKAVVCVGEFRLGIISLYPFLQRPDPVFHSLRSADPALRFHDSFWGPVDWIAVCLENFQITKLGKV